MLSLLERVQLPVFAHSGIRSEAGLVEGQRCRFCVSFIVDISQISGHYWLLHIKSEKREGITTSFSYFGFQNVVENMILNNQRFMNRQTERQMITAIDAWHGLTEEKIHEMELKCMKELKEMIKSKELSQAYSPYL